MLPPLLAAFLLQALAILTQVAALSEIMRLVAMALLVQAYCRSPKGLDLQRTIDLANDLLHQALLARLGLQVALGRSFDTAFWPKKLLHALLRADFCLFRSRFRPKMESGAFQQHLEALQAEYERVLLEKSELQKGLLQDFEALPKPQALVFDVFLSWVNPQRGSRPCFDAWKT